VADFAQANLFQRDAPYADIGIMLSGVSAMVRPKGLI
jgi:hypothetical protein